MLILLSPAKTLDFSPTTIECEPTRPYFHRQANDLATIMKAFSSDEIESLMKVSPALAESVVSQFASWKKKFNPIQSKPSIVAYQGDVYLGMSTSDWSSEQLEYAQSHLRIISGLYGILRPLDLIQPYRMEMGLKVATNGGKTLVEFWRDRLTRFLKRELAKQRHRVIVNLASSEYSQAIDFEKLKADVITPNFHEMKDGKARFLSFFGKKARGMMARYLVEQKVDSAGDVLRFNIDDYAWNEKLSQPSKPIFTRRQRSMIAS